MNGVSIMYLFSPLGPAFVPYVIEQLLQYGLHFSNARGWHAAYVFDTSSTYVRNFQFATE